MQIEMVAGANPRPGQAWLIVFPHFPLENGSLIFSCNTVGFPQWYYKVFKKLNCRLYAHLHQEHEGGRRPTGINIIQAVSPPPTSYLCRGCPHETEWATFFCLKTLKLVEGPLNLKTYQSAKNRSDTYGLLIFWPASVFAGQSLLVINWQMWEKNISTIHSQVSGLTKAYKPRRPQLLKR
jgi:hypothetical protein